MFRNRAFGVLALLFLALSLISALSTHAADLPGCNCRMRLRVVPGMGGIEFQCPTDNCSPILSCKSFNIAGTKW